MRFLGYKSALLVVFASISVTSFAQDCSESEDGDLFVDKDWHGENSFIGSPDGRYPENGGIAPFLTIQALIDALQPGQCGFVRESSTPYSEVGRKPYKNTGGNTFLRGGSSASNRLVVSGFPGERPIIDNGNRTTSEGHGVAGFFVSEGNYITIRNFEIRNTKGPGVLMDPSLTNRGITVENCLIHHNYGQDNIGGVRLDWCVDCLVKNNIIHDIYVDAAGSNPITGEPHAMHSGIHGYRPSNSVIENNIIYNVAKGVYQKEPHPDGGNSNIVRYNIFRDISESAFLVGNMGAGLTPSYNATFNHNILVNVKGAVDVDHYEAAGTASGLKVFNNTVVGGDYLVSIANVRDVEVYNNIFFGDSDSGIIVSKRPGNSPRSNSFKEISHNLYYGASNFALLDRYLDTSTTFRSFQTWSNASEVTTLKTGLPTDVEMGSLVSDPKFVSLLNQNFVLLSDSPALGAGKNGATIGALGNGVSVGPDSTMLKSRITKTTLCVNAANGC